MHTRYAYRIDGLAHCGSCADSIAQRSSSGGVHRGRCGGCSCIPGSKRPCLNGLSRNLADAVVDTYEALLPVRIDGGMFTCRTWSTAWLSMTYAHTVCHKRTVSWPAHKSHRQNDQAVHLQCYIGNRQGGHGLAEGGLALVCSTHTYSPKLLKIRMPSLLDDVSHVSMGICN